MSFQTSIQVYDASGNLGSGSNQSLPIWDQNRVVVANNFTSDLWLFNLLTGTSLVTNGFAELAPPMANDRDGFLYLQKTASNYNGQDRIRMSDMTVVGTWGHSSGLDGPPDNVGLPICMAMLTVQSAPYLLGVSQDLANEVWLVNASVPSFAGFNQDYDESGAACVAGGSTSTTATGWIIGYPAFGNPQQYGIYSVVVDSGAALWTPDEWPTQNSGVTLTKLVTILPTDIDPSWVNPGHPAIIYDQTDGNLIVLAQTSDSVTNPFYIFKVNASTGGIMWKTPFVAYQPGTANQPGLSRIRHGVYCFLATHLGVQTLHEVNTLTGVDTTSTTGFAGLSPGAQCFDDTSGIIFGNFSYTAGAGTPTQRGSTPSSFAGQWAALYAVPAFVPPYIPGGQQAWTKIWGAFAR